MRCAVTIPDGPCFRVLLGYSAFSGGILIPGIVVVGFMLIPFLDRESDGVGRRFTNPGDRRIALFTCFAASSAILTCFATFLRGPNRDFCWSEARWPGTH